MQTSSPLILTLAYICKCDLPRDIEEAAHVILEPYRRHREWFEVDLETAIEALREPLRRRGTAPERNSERFNTRSQHPTKGRKPKIFADLDEIAI